MILIKNEKKSSKSIQPPKYNSMKSYVLTAFLFTSLIAFSQHNKKEVLSLFDSIMAIEPYEQLYTKINTLQLENKQERYQFIRLNDAHTMLKEYFFRQDWIYIKKSLIN
ncbi:MAG: hypothetical protein ACI87N_001000 [Flavobacteriales bacterium]